MEDGAGELGDKLICFRVIFVGRREGVGVCVCVVVVLLLRLVASVALVVGRTQDEGEMVENGRK